MGEYLVYAAGIIQGMETPAKSIRLKKVVDVMQLASDGLTISSACKLAGISRSSFYQILNKEPQLFLDLHVELNETMRAQLASILVVRADVLRHLIRDGLSDTTKPLERLAIHKEIEKHLERLSSLLRMSGGNSQAATEVLSGPVFVQAESRFAAEVSSSRV